MCQNTLGTRPVLPQESQQQSTNRNSPCSGAKNGIRNPKLFYIVFLLTPPPLFPDPPPVFSPVAPPSFIAPEANAPQLLRILINMHNA
jgi:hypothetical protein